MKGKKKNLTPEQTKARQEWARKWANVQKEQKLNRNVKIYGDILDITHRELIAYRLEQTTCEMCGIEANSKRNGMNKNLVVDHCHKTNKFRGLLCISCNRFLGYYENSKELAEAYLNNGH